VISHDMASTFRIGDRISMLYDGQMIVSGTPEELLANPHPALREFVEVSGAVTFSGSDPGVIGRGAS
jgi:phospholipid/cholesterol/gamma-HCH transport system ATP-binding protein